MPKARILIVDDEESTRELFAELLQRWGYEVDQTADGHGALKLAAEPHPDAIISDLVMRKLDGLALVRALREEQPDTPVVIMTGEGTIDAAVEAVREGVFDFVEAPRARAPRTAPRTAARGGARRRRHALPRRGGRGSRRAAVEVPPRAGGGAAAPAGPQERDHGGRAGDQRHQQGAERGDQGAEIPRGPLLPAECIPHQ